MNNKIIQMPKGVTHLHVDGSLRAETVREYLEELLGKEIELEEVRKLLMVDKDCRDLNQYLEKFDVPVKVLQTTEHIERAVFELYEDLAKQNVVWAEARFAPSLHTLLGLSYDEIVEAAISGLNRAKAQYGIDGNLILCCMRGEGEDNRTQNIETVKAAKKYLGQGVGAIDLAGAEALFATENFEEIFRIAKELEIPFTIHAGEADGPDSIRKALEFGAKRIGHGVRCIEDKELMEQLKEKGVTLEVCPISNMQTQAVQGKHPIEELFRAGIRITISPDNSTVSNTNIFEEYNWILENTGLTISDLEKMNEYAVSCIFGTEEQKKKISNILRRKSTPTEPGGRD